MLRRRALSLVASFVLVAVPGAQGDRELLSFALGYQLHDDAPSFGDSALVDLRWRHRFGEQGRWSVGAGFDLLQRDHGTEPSFEDTVVATNLLAGWNSTTVDEWTAGATNVYVGGGLSWVRSREEATTGGISTSEVDDDPGYLAELIVSERVGESLVVESGLQYAWREVDDTEFGGWRFAVGLAVAY